MKMTIAELSRPAGMRSRVKVNVLVEWLYQAPVCIVVLLDIFS